MERIKNIGFWGTFKLKHPEIAQFIVLSIISNGVTVLQMVPMLLIKYLFGFTPSVSTSFQVLPVGHNLGDGIYYVFNYAVGNIASSGGGGLAYLLAVEITLLTAQVINFFLRQNMTFESNTSAVRAAVWYSIAWVVTSVGAAALQGLYKTSTYTLFMSSPGSGAGTTVADIIMMLINCVISLWVFYPILKVIFKEKEGQTA